MQRRLFLGVLSLGAAWNFSGCSGNNVRGSETGEDSNEESGTPPTPAIRQGKNSKKFSKENLCELQVYSNRPFGVEPVLDNHVDACLEHPDTTQAEPGTKGYAFITFGGGAARGDHMGVTFKCATESGNLIGQLKVNKFSQVPKDTPLSTISWFFEGIGKALKGNPEDDDSQPDTDPGFSIVVDASAIPEAERADIPPLHKPAAIKYCKQMIEIRDRVFPKKEKQKVVLAPDE